MATLRGRHLVDVAFVLGMRGIAALGGIAFVYVIAQEYGLQELGNITILLSILGIANLFSKAGVDTSAMRETGRLLAGHRKHSVSAQVFKASLNAIKWPLGASVLVFTAILASGFFGSYSPVEIACFVVLLPSLTVASLFSGILRGEGRSGIAALFEIGSISGVAAVLLAAGLAISIPLSPVGALLMSGLAAASVALWATRPESPREDSQSAAMSLSGSWHFMITGMSLFVLQAGSFAIAGPFLDAETIGQLRVIERLSLLVTFPMLAVNAYFSPHASRLQNAMNPKGVYSLWLSASLATALLSIPIAIILLVFPAAALQAFEVEATEALVAFLRWVVAATLVFAVLGPASMIANMIGFERRIARMSLALLLIGIPLYAFFTYQNGAIGFLAIYCCVVTVQGARSAFVLWSATRNYGA